MEYLSLTILFCAMLYFVDRNGAWRGLWRTVKTIFAVSLVLCVIGGTCFFVYDRHQTQKAEAAEKAAASLVFNADNCTPKTSTDMTPEDPIEWLKKRRAKQRVK